MKSVKALKYTLFFSILVSLGPLLCLFINIYNKKYDKLGLNIILVIITVFFLAFNIRRYLKMNNRKDNKFLEVMGIIIAFLFYVLLIALCVIFFCAFYLGITLIQKKLFINGEYLIYMIKSPYSYLVFFIMILSLAQVEFIFLKVKEFNKYIILSILLSIYIIITSTVVVTENGIYDYSFYNLKGDKYEFSDVEYVDTGFIYKGRNKGQFFYNIKLNDGKKIKLAHPSLTQPGKQYDDDTWQEYVDIDKLIMNSNAKKTSSEKGSEYIDMDNIYVDKFLKVVRNK